MSLEIRAATTYVNAIEQGGHLLVAIESDTVIGFGGIYIQPPAAEVKAVFVHPEATGHGAGRALLEALEAEAIKAGCTHFSLPASLTARRFYENNGYRASAPIQHRFANGIEMTCIPMTKIVAPSTAL